MSGPITGGAFTVQRKELLAVTLSGFLGTTIEWYDFLLSGITAALVWPTVFFPSYGLLSGLLVSISVYGLGFVARPVGAAIFGHLGDRRGRKSTLIWTLLVMGLGTLALGLTPGYATIGVLGGVLVTVFRLLQGVGFGGEWGGSSTWVMEFASKSRWRSFWTSWVQQGAIFGLLLSNGAFFLAEISLGGVAGSAFLAWGWRIPFFANLVLIALAIVIRQKLSETPVFNLLLERKAPERVPSLKVWKERPGLILKMIGAKVYVDSAFWTVTVFSGVFLSALGISGMYTGSVVVAAAVAFFTGLLGAIFSSS